MELVAQLVALRDAAAAAVPGGVERSFLAGGPSFAADCHQVVAYVDTINTNPLRGRASFGEVPGGECSSVPAPSLRVAYVKDCYPGVRTGGGTARPPSAASITAWTTEFLTAVDLIYGALMGAVDTAPPFGGDCKGVTVQPVAISGPLGGVCIARFGFTVADT